MNWSIKLLTVRGIDIRVHASFWLVLIWAAYLGLRANPDGAAGDWLGSVSFMVLLVLLLFVCVVLHELAHSLVAQLFGVKVQDITLWPIGGLARMARLPERSYQEFLISAAGPAMNVLLALVLGVALVLWVSPQRTIDVLLTAGRPDGLLRRTDAQTMLLLLAVNNIILAVFNLIPAFPMDGGRLLRSLLATIMPFARATRIASLVGQVAAALMVFAGLFSGNPVLSLVGLLIFVAAGQERHQVAYDDHLSGLCVRHAMQAVAQRLHPLQTLGDAADQVGASTQPAYLVVDGGRLTGLLTRGNLLAALRKAGPAARVGPYVQREFVRLGAEEPLLVAQSRMAESKDRIGVVVDQGSVVGLLSTMDIARMAEMRAAYRAGPGHLQK